MNDKYKVVNGTYYNKETPYQLIDILEKVRQENKRIRIFYGDTETGRSWNEEHDIIGTLSRSAGQRQIPILMYNSRSYGGTAILDNRIIRVTLDKRIIYTHDNFHIGTLAHKKNNVYINGTLQASFNNEKQAKNYMAFLKGDRNRI